MTAVVGFGITGAAAAYTRLQSNIEAVDVTELLGEDRPTPTTTPDPNDPNAGLAMNIVLIGSDVRDGENADIGGEVAGMRSDATIVMHIAADRSRVELVSIPRDTLVDIPPCPRSDGTISRPRRAQFNEAFAIGAETGEKSDAAVCTILTVEELTDVHIHEYVVIDFAGFTGMIDALGGVPMCIPHDMRSEESQLELSAGDHLLDGRTALAFARARKGEGLGDGSDIGRIARQQQLLAATVHTVQSKNLLTDVPELLGFLDAATSSVTASPTVASIPGMTGLAFSLRETLSSNIAFRTMPFAPAPSDPNRVVMTDEAHQLWSNIAADVPALTPPTDKAQQPDTVAPTEPAVPAEPQPVPTPGRDAITPNDVATVCS